MTRPWDRHRFDKDPFSQRFQPPRDPDQSYICSVKTRQVIFEDFHDPALLVHGRNSYLNFT
jgi:hypothetical protein